MLELRETCREIGRLRKQKVALVASTQLYSTAQRSIVLKTFVRQQYAGRHFCPRKPCSEQCSEEKDSKEALPFHVSKAKPHLPRVGYINLTTRLMDTTPSPGVTNSTSQTSLSQPTAWCSFLFTFLGRL